VAPDQFGALERQSVIGVVVRVSDLTVGDPDNRLGVSPTAQRPREYRAVDAVAMLPERIVVATDPRSAMIHTLGVSPLSPGRWL